MKIDKNIFVNILNNLKQVPFDKLVHLCLGFLLNLCLAAFFSFGVSFILSAILIVFKEYYDQYSKTGCFDYGDIKYSLGGAAAGEILSYFLKYHWLLLF